MKFFPVYAKLNAQHIIPFDFLLVVNIPVLVIARF